MKLERRSDVYLVKIVSEFLVQSCRCEDRFARRPALESIGDLESDAESGRKLEEISSEARFGNSRSHAIQNKGR